MSGDLISRSALMEEIENLRVNVTGLRTGKGILHEFMKQYRASVLKVIDDAPTAYDVDKVVEQLKNKRKEAVLKAPAYAGLHDKEFQKWMMKSYGFEEAIEIVKAGGME